MGQPLHDSPPRRRIQRPADAMAKETTGEGARGVAKRGLVEACDAASIGDDPFALMQDASLVPQVRASFFSFSSLHQFLLHWPCHVDVSSGRAFFLLADRAGRRDVERAPDVLCLGRCRSRDDTMASHVPSPFTPSVIGHC